MCEALHRPYLNCYKLRTHPNRLIKLFMQFNNIKVHEQFNYHSAVCCSFVHGVVVAAV